MELERVAAAIRPRRSWEAIDLGFAMVRVWWRPIYAAWAVTVLPAVFLVFVLLRSWPTLALFVVWWLKPVFDRVPLFVVSRRLFGDALGARDVLRAAPRLLTRRLASSLVLYRLSPIRSYLLPVSELEGLRGVDWLRRARVIARRRGMEATMLTWLLLAFDSALGFAALALVAILVPEGVGPGFATFLELPFELDAPGWFVALEAFLAAVTLSIVEPLYVAAGFALYLDRRVHLEGWDLELGFRRLGRRIESGARARAGRVAVATALLLGGALAPLALAQSTDPAAAIEEVLAHPDFDRTVERTVWTSGSESGDLPVRGIIDALAPAIEVVLWVFAVALAVWIAVLAGRWVGWIEGRGRRRETVEEPVTEAFGLDLRPESLPEDVAGAARALAEQRRFREALGLLYRASIASLIERDGLRLTRADTEEDCLARARELTADDRAGLFRELTVAWQSCAYARRPPPLERARALCEGWRAAFGGGA